MWALHLMADLMGGRTLDYFGTILHTLRLNNVPTIDLGDGVKIQNKIASRSQAAAS